MAQHRCELLVVGASAGGVQTLLRLFSVIGPAFRLPVAVVLHMPDDRDSGLADLFARRLPIAVREAADKMPLAPSTVYFAPPGYHLQIESDAHFSLSCDEPVLFSRPAIDVLFESAAFAMGPRLAAMLLTGASEDGAAGMAQVARLGGFTAVQDPADASVATMPQAAIDRHVPERILPIEGLQQLLLALDAGHPALPDAPASHG